MVGGWPRSFEGHRHRWAMLCNELAIAQRQTSSDVIPFRQLLQLREAKGGAQFVHTVVEPKDRNVVIGTTTVEALARAACHSMRPCTPDGVPQGTAVGNDGASFGGSHVLVAVKAEGRGLTKGPNRRQPRRMGRILDQQQAL